MEINIEYPTHRLILSTAPNGYTKIKNYVLGTTYQDMVDVILSEEDKALHFVHNERILLHNFLSSLLDFHNKNVLMPPFSFFKDEYELYVFCLVNDIEFNEQEWFNTAYIKCDVLTTLVYLKNASIQLISLAYPEYKVKPANLLQQWYVRVKEFQARYKCDPEMYKSFLEQNEIECLYHFTSSKNSESIAQRGICSIKYLKENGILVDYVSTTNSQYIDKIKGLEDYVHLGYESKHPMLMSALAKGVLSSYKLYEVNPIVLFLKDTMYSRCNAIKRGAIIDDRLDFFLSIPFGEFHKKNYFRLGEQQKELFQSEVLVKNVIPNSLILS